jgi:hypothetical protein
MKVGNGVRVTSSVWLYCYGSTMVLLTRQQQALEQHAAYCGKVSQRALLHAATAYLVGLMVLSRQRAEVWMQGIPRMASTAAAFVPLSVRQQLVACMLLKPYNQKL